LSQKHFYEFGPFRIDVALTRLQRAGEVIPLSPKCFDLLLLLARNTDRVMAKGELMETLWPNTFVEEANLTQHVYTLRKALGDQPTGQPYIDTVPRRGYRLAAEVRKVTIDPLAGGASAGAHSTGPPRPAAVEGERKRVTVVHGHIANAADAIERLGPEAMLDLTGRLLTLVSEAIARYEGVISHRFADGFEAIFGAAIVHEDDARRATLAALEIQKRVQSLSTPAASDGETFALQIGISTGSLIVTRMSTATAVEYSGIGDAAKEADLLQQLAEPGAILIGDATRRAIEGHVETHPTGMTAAGAPVFRAVRRVRGPIHGAGAARKLSRFVGRGSELAALAELATQARCGRGQVVDVIGEPGMGKSRLVHELCRALTAGAPILLLEGRCVSYGSLIPYLPLADLVRTHCGVTESDPPDAIRDAVARTVRETDLPADAGTWLLRLIGIVDAESALDALSPEAIKVRTFDALRTLFLKASTRTPLVVVVVCG